MAYDREWQRDYYNKNRQKINAYHREYKKRPYVQRRISQSLERTREVRLPYAKRKARWYGPFKNHLDRAEAHGCAIGNIQLLQRWYQWAAFSPIIPCSCCGKLTTDAPYQRVRHHVIDLAKGGAHDVGNLVVLCPECHRQADYPSFELTCWFVGRKGIPEIWPEPRYDTAPKNPLQTWAKPEGRERWMRLLRRFYERRTSA